MCYAALNWKTMESYTDILILMFLWKLISLPASCIYNKLCIDRLIVAKFHTSTVTSNLQSPIRRMYTTALKYGLGENVFDMLESGNLLPRSRWFSTVRKVVTDIQTAKWHMKSSMYKYIDLAFFPHPACLQWWRICKERPFLVRKCKILVSLIIGSHNLGCGKGRHVHKTKLCQICDSFVEETISHFLLECPSLDTTRVALYSELCKEMPHGMLNSFNLMSTCKQAEFLLCELGRSNVREWDQILIQIIELVYCLHAARDKLSKS